MHKLTIEVPCTMSNTGRHPVTLNFSETSGNKLSPSRLSCPCRGDADGVAVATALGERTCAGFVNKVVSLIQNEGLRYGQAREELASYCGRERYGALSNVYDVVEELVQYARHRFMERNKPAPVEMNTRADRWERVINAKSWGMGLTYRFRVETHGEGYLLFVKSVDEDGDVGGAVRVGYLSGNGRNAYAIRTHMPVVGKVGYSHRGKADWCHACKAPVRGLRRHAEGAQHRAVVRRDMFAVMRAICPNRVVREVSAADLDAVLESHQKEAFARTTGRELCA